MENGDCKIQKKKSNKTLSALKPSQRFSLCCCTFCPSKRVNCNATSGNMKTFCGEKKIPSMFPQNKLEFRVWLKITDGKILFTSHQMNVTASFCSYFDESFIFGSNTATTAPNGIMNQNTIGTLKKAIHFKYFKWVNTEVKDKRIEISKAKEITLFSAFRIAFTVKMLVMKFTVTRLTDADFREHDLFQD